MNEAQDTDSGIEVKATIPENKDGKDEPDTTNQNKDTTSLEHKNPEPEVAEYRSDDNNDEEEEIKSPKSLKELSNNVVRASSTSNEAEGKSEGSTEDSVFANFESAFPEGLLSSF